MRMKVIAGIGSRKTPAPILDLMTELGSWCRENNIWVRSGHSSGADYAFEKGAREKTIVYLPWPRFNENLELLTGKVVSWSDVAPEIQSAAGKSVWDFHPVPGILTSTSMKLLARDYLQIMGSRANSPRSQAVVCYTPRGKGGGGTGQAIRIAKHYNIPVLDLGAEGELFAKLEKVKEWVMAQLA